MSEKWGNSWQREMCGWWAGKALWFPWHLVPQPGLYPSCWGQMYLTHSYHSSWACVWRVLDYWLHGNHGIPGNSAGLLPSQVIPCVYEWDTWVQAFPRQCSTVGSQGCEGKCAALRLVLCAIFTPFDVSGSVSRTSAAVLLLRISCGSSSHRLGNLR